MSALLERSSNTVGEAKSRKMSKGGLTQKENAGLHSSKRVTATPARKPLGNVSNTVRETLEPKRIPASKKKPNPVPLVEEEEYHEIEYMPIQPHHDVKEPFQEPDYFKGILDIISNPSLFSIGKEQLVQEIDKPVTLQQVPLRSTHMFSQTADIGDIDDFTLTIDLPHLDDIIL